MREMFAKGAKQDNIVDIRRRRSKYGTDFQTTIIQNLATQLFTVLRKLLWKNCLMIFHAQDGSGAFHAPWPLHLNNGWYHQTKNPSTHFRVTECNRLGSRPGLLTDKTEGYFLWHLMVL